MPATLLSHQALVLPLKMRWPRRFSGLALCIGSMAPDIEFIGRMADDWVFSHTLSAQLWFTVPVTMCLVWVFTALVLPAWLPFLRDHPRLRLHDLAALQPPATAREWRQVALSGFIGGVSHVVLDGITHGNHSGWLVPWFPFLRRQVPHFHGTVPLHDALQLWLTVLFALVSLWCWSRITRHRLLWQWRGLTVTPLPRQSRRAGWRRFALVVACAAIGASFGLAGSYESQKAAAAAVVFGAIDVAAAGVILLALDRRNSHRRTGSGFTADAPLPS